MARTKVSTIRAAAGTKTSRKIQLANARKQRKVMKKFVNFEEKPELKPRTEQFSAFNEVVTDSVPSFSSTSTSCGEESQIKRESCEFMDSSSCESISTVEDDDVDRILVDFSEMDEIIKQLCCPVCKNMNLILKTRSNLIKKHKGLKGLVVPAEVYCFSCEEVIRG